MAIDQRRWNARLEGHETWRMAPTAVEQITVDFADLLDGDTIASYTLTTEAPLAYGSDSSTASTVTTSLISGVDGGNYLVTLVATMTGAFPRKLVWTCTVQVRIPLAGG